MIHMKRRTIATTVLTLLTLCLVLSSQSFAFHAELSSQQLKVDGEAVECEKYNIDGSNYFKLRDIAAIMNGTGSQFDVGWDDAKGVVTITSNHAYDNRNGTELVLGEDLSNTAKKSEQIIIIDGSPRNDLLVYNIGGSNFFKLRDLGDCLGFEVEYDANSNTVLVATKEIISVDSISLDQVAFTLVTGETKRITAKVSPAGVDVHWKSGNPDIAAVDEKGIVTGIATGKVDIYAFAGDKSAFCTVQVTEPVLVSAPFVGGDYGTLFKDNVTLGFYRNSVDGIFVGWMAENLSGKTINYYTVRISLYNSVGDPAYDSITGKNTINMKFVGPVQPKGKLALYDVVGYSSVCSKVTIDSIYLEFADGTSSEYYYGYSGGKTLFHKYHNNWLTG